MKGMVLTGGVMFAVGFSAAWLLKPETPRTIAAAPLETARRNSERSRKPAQSARVRQCMEMLDAAKAQNQPEKFSEFESLSAKLDGSEIPLLIEQMIRRAGFSGLDRQQKSAIGELVKGWYGRDPGSALAWVAAIKQPLDRQTLMGVIVAKESEKDFDHAVELAQRYGTRELGGLQMSYEMAEKLGDLSAERMFEVLSAFPSDSGSVYTSVTFAKDFDFAGFAAKLTETEGGSGSLLAAGLSLYPYNFLTEWTKRDPESAWKWVIEGDDTGSNLMKDPDLFFEAYRTNHSVEEINGLILNHIAAQTDDRAKFNFAWRTLSARVDPVQIGDFIDRLPGERSENLLQLVRVSELGYGGVHDQFKEALVGQMSPDEQRWVLSRAGFDNNYYGQIRKRLGIEPSKESE